MTLTCKIRLAKKLVDTIHNIGLIKIVLMFMKNYFMLNKAAFIWLKLFLQIFISVTSKLSFQ